MGRLPNTMREAAASPALSLLDHPSGSAAPELPGLVVAAPEQAAAPKPGHAPGFFSAAAFFCERKEDYQRIAKACAEGLSDRAIVAIFGVGKATVRAIRTREAGSATLDNYRRTQGALARSVNAAAMSELLHRLEEHPEALGVKELAAIVREAHNQERTLAGEPTQIVGSLRPAGDDAAAIEALLDAVAGVHGMGFAAEDSEAARGRAPVVVDAEVVDQGEQPAGERIGAEVDSASPAKENENPTKQKENARADTELDTQTAAGTAPVGGCARPGDGARAEPAGPSKTGGEGVRASDGGVVSVDR